MEKPDLKVVGEIKPPPYKEPVTMLRNLANDIEKGKYGEVTCIAIATFGDDGLQVFGGGIDSEGPVVAMMFQSASMKLCQSLVDHEGING